MRERERGGGGGGGGGYQSVFLATIDQSQRIFMRYTVELPRYQRSTERFIGSVGNGTDEKIFTRCPQVLHSPASLSIS